MRQIDVMDMVDIDVDIANALVVDFELFDELVDIESDFADLEFLDDVLEAF